MCNNRTQPSKNLQHANYNLGYIDEQLSPFLFYKKKNTIIYLIVPGCIIGKKYFCKIGLLVEQSDTSTCHSIPGAPVYIQTSQSPHTNYLSLCLFPLLCFGAKHAFPVVKLLFIIVTCQNVHHFYVSGALTKCFECATMAKKELIHGLSLHCTLSHAQLLL